MSGEGKLTETFAVGRLPFLAKLLHYPTPRTLLQGSEFIVMTPLVSLIEIYTMIAPYPPKHWSVSEGFYVFLLSVFVQGWTSFVQPWGTSSAQTQPSQTAADCQSGSLINTDSPKLRDS